MADGRQIHATAVAINDLGVLLTGKAGSGKSDLALRLIDRGAILIGDDAIQVDIEGDQAILRSMPNISGKMEVRNLGILNFSTTNSAPLALCVALDGKPERHPDPDFTFEFEGIHVPKILLAAFEASAAIKVELALHCLNRHDARDA